MTDQEIAGLRETKRQHPDLYWISPHDNTVHRVLGFNMNWIEFPDEPELVEPAAALPNGKVIALRSCDLGDFALLARLGGKS